MKADAEEYTKEELDGINLAKHAVKEFVSSLCNHLKSLHDYLHQVKKDKPL